MLAQLESEGREFSLVENVTDTSRLYVLRLPDGVDRSALDGSVTIVDGVESQFLVDIPGPPPYVLDLVDQGISIEKLPPLLPVIPARGEKPEISDPGAVAESISVGQLKQRVSDLQSMGAAEGAARQPGVFTGRKRASSRIPVSPDRQLWTECLVRRLHS